MHYLVNGGCLRAGIMILEEHEMRRVLTRGQGGPCCLGAVTLATPPTVLQTSEAATHIYNTWGMPTSLFQSVSSLFPKNLSRLSAHHRRRWWTMYDSANVFPFISIIQFLMLFKVQFSLRSLGYNLVVKMKHFWQMRAKLTISKIVWCRELWGREGNRWGATMSSTRLQRTMHFSQIELESVRLKPFSWFFFEELASHYVSQYPQALPANMGGPCRVQSCFAEMLCDFCSYELKNRYENSGGMNNIKDQHAGFVIASLEKENTTTLFFCTI